MNRFYIDWKKGLEMIRHRASVEIAAMLIVSIFCCAIAENYPTSRTGNEAVVVSLSSENEQDRQPSPQADADEAAKDAEAPPVTETVPESEAATAEAAAEEVLPPPTEAELMAQAVPSPVRLNMAYAFVSDASNEPSDSYAGKAYYSLTSKDEAWVSRMYANREAAPGVMAVNLGITGKNISDYSEWTNVGLLFYDGDGNMISGYSNAREIMAMANVYSFFHPFESIDEFYQYTGNLWNASHKYSISVSDIYFCEGECKYDSTYIDEDDSDVSWADPDGLAPVESTAEGTIRIGPWSESPGSAEDSGGPLGILDEAAAVPENALAADAAADVSAATAAPAADPAMTSMAVPADDTSITSSVTPESPEASAGPLASFVESSEASADNAAETEVPTAEMTVPSAEISTEASETEESVGSGGPLGFLSSSAAAEQHSDASEAASGAESAPEETLPAADEAGQESLASSETIQSGPLAETQAEESGSADEAEEEKECKGHIDLTIHATIIGLNETGTNLFRLDEKSRSEEEYTDTWKGWSMLRKRYVQTLMDQDWYDLYGLRVPASLYIQNPLTAAEIRYYMNMMPEDTAEERKALVKLALESVGCIPYYWGGKPSGPGYEANGFGTLINPDENGRSLRGLDCSGWISWLYWTALGRHLPYESTAGLYALGRQVDRSELKPGDYIVRTGDDAHVCLFLAWAPDGTMYVIHERGSSSNNVIVSNIDLYWPYYRNLLD